MGASTCDGNRGLLLSREFLPVLGTGTQYIRGNGELGIGLMGHLERGVVLLQAVDLVFWKL